MYHIRYSMGGEMLLEFANDNLSRFAAEYVDFEVI
jgi:hypothetical protein